MKKLTKADTVKMVNELRTKDSAIEKANDAINTVNEAIVDYNDSINRE